MSYFNYPSSLNNNNNHLLPSTMFYPGLTSSMPAFPSMLPPSLRFPTLPMTPPPAHSTPSSTTTINSSAAALAAVASLPPLHSTSSMPSTSPSISSFSQNISNAFSSYLSTLSNNLSNVPFSHAAMTNTSETTFSPSSLASRSCPVTFSNNSSDNNATKSKKTSHHQPSRNHSSNKQPALNKTSRKQKSLTPGKVSSLLNTTSTSSTSATSTVASPSFSSYNLTSNLTLPSLSFSNVLPSSFVSSSTSRSHQPLPHRRRSGSVSTNNSNSPLATIFDCRVCHERFFSHETLRKHVKTIHQRKSKQSQQRPPSRSTPTNNFVDYPFSLNVNSNNNSTTEPARPPHNFNLNDPSQVEFFSNVSQRIVENLLVHVDGRLPSSTTTSSVSNTTTQSSLSQSINNMTSATMTPPTTSQATTLRDYHRNHHQLSRVDDLLERVMIGWQYEQQQKKQQVDHAIKANEAAASKEQSINEKKPTVCICTVCGSRFPDRKKFIDHANNNHANVAYSYISAPDDVPSNLMSASKYATGILNRKAQETTTTSHVDVLGSNKPTSVTGTDIRKFKCTGCETEFESTDLLNDHILDCARRMRKLAQKNRNTMNPPMTPTSKNDSKVTFSSPETDDSTTCFTTRSGKKRQPPPMPVIPPTKSKKAKISDKKDEKSKSSKKKSIDKKVEDKSDEKQSKSSEENSQSKRKSTNIQVGKSTEESHENDAVDKTETKESAKTSTNKSATKEKKRKKDPCLELVPEPITIPPNSENKRMTRQSSRRRNYSQLQEKSKNDQEQQENVENKVQNEEEISQSNRVKLEGNLEEETLILNEEDIIELDEKAIVEVGGTTAEEISRKSLIWQIKQDNPQYAFKGSPAQHHSCPYCQRGFTYLANYRKHIKDGLCPVRQQIEEKKKMAIEGGSNVSSENTIEIESATISNNIVIATTNATNDLTNNKTIIPSTTSPSNNNNNSINNTKLKTFSCNVCHKIYFSYVELMKHRLSHKLATTSANSSTNNNSATNNDNSSEKPSSTESSRKSSIDDNIDEPAEEKFARDVLNSESIKSRRFSRSSTGSSSRRGSRMNSMTGQEDSNSNEATSNGLDRRPDTPEDILESLARGGQSIIKEEEQEIDEILSNEETTTTTMDKSLREIIIDQQEEEIIINRSEATASSTSGDDGVAVQMKLTSTTTD